MRTTIDKAGRIVVPKVMRDAIGLTGGSPVEIALVEGKIEIEAAPGDIRLERGDDGRLVAVSDRELPVLTAERVRDLLEQVRR
jgi:AbrB family looped-hinge helix DNA binding protein